MNRRSFVTKLFASAFAFSILPSAGRLWKANKINRFIGFDPAIGQGQSVILIYQQLPNYLALMQYKQMRYKAWDNLFAKQTWPKNIGSTILQQSC